MKVETWPIERVVPYENNPRVNADAVAAVVTSIREFGWQQPLVVDRDGVIIVGHTRRLAATKLGLSTLETENARMKCLPKLINAWSRSSPTLPSFL